MQKALYMTKNQLKQKYCLQSSKQIGKYAILKTIGHGATCKVKMAFDLDTGQRVAMKVMNEDIEEKVLFEEINAMSQVDHQNVLKLIDYGYGEYQKKDKPSRNVFFIVLEYAGVGDLFDLIAHSGGFSEELTRYYFKQFLEALQYCHERGIAHRDIKIENVLLLD